ncbi:MAG: NTP transferase domain-containing protein [Pseudomonadota bacterium]
MTRSSAPLHGLLLVGGRSRRMREDKALLRYREQRTQLSVAHEMLAAVVEGSVKLSVREDQREEPERARHAQIVDIPEVQGPASGIRAAQLADPQAAWLVLACDLPRLGLDALRALVVCRDPQADATAFVSAHDGLPEPLCAIWEPSSAPILAATLSEAGNGPRQALLRMNTTLIEQADPASLDNANTPDERLRIARALQALAPRVLARAEGNA